MGGGGCARSSAMRAADSTERTGRVPWATKWIREFRSAASTRKTSSSESNTAQPGSYLCVGSIGDTIVRFAMRHALSRLALLITVAAFAPPDAAASPQIDSAYGPLPVFELHSGFWMNLHHTLYQQARQQREKQSGRPNAAPSSRLSDAEQRIWDAAVAYYAANFANKDLLFSTELILLKNQLGDFEDCVELSGAQKKTCDAGLPPKITQVLDSAAPAYRDHWWPEHDRANRKWIAGVAALVRSRGLELAERLAEIYQTKWPAEKIRVDVSSYANWAGAYTTLDPLRPTISSTDPRNQGSAALEVLFHEASHGIAEPVQAAIAPECRQRDKPIPPDPWHALIFYTTGELIRPVMTSPGAGAEGGAPSGEYTHTALRQGLYTRGWDAYLRVLTTFWQPYLDGKSTFDDAIARMVSAL